jgi:hypothetical protein
MAAAVAVAAVAMAMAMALALALATVEGDRGMSTLLLMPLLLMTTLQLNILVAKQIKLVSPKKTPNQYVKKYQLPLRISSPPSKNLVIRSQKVLRMTASKNLPTLLNILMTLDKFLPCQTTSHSFKAVGTI